jgi:phosphotransferase system enzyme I (PtsI)
MARSGRRGAGRTVVTGLPMAPGLAIGMAVFHGEADVDIPVRAISQADVAAEKERLGQALGAARRRLTDVEQVIEREVGPHDARIFSVQGLLLEDPTFRSGIERRIEDNLVNAEVAVRDEVVSWEQRLSAVASGGDRDPAADLRDVGRQVLRELVGHQRVDVEGGEAGERVILVTRELLPSDAVHLDRNWLAAIVTGSGGQASHAAILARSLGIPAVTSIDVGSLPARGGRWIVDGSSGRVIVNPTQRDLQAADRRSRHLQKFREELLAETHGLVTTTDGVAIEVLYNVENFEKLPDELLDDLRGIGLYRTEFLFLHRESFPSEEEQYEHYVGAIERVGGREITFRTIDVGGDKPLAYLTVPHEPNPVLGWRGLRLSLEWPDMFYAQLRALLRASAHGSIRIMLPMVTMVEEFRRAREIVGQLQADLRKSHIAYDENVPVGAMIEVPAAALSARNLAREADFLSIGTNDLSQYALAVDRNNSRVAALYQPLHPGLLNLVRLVLEAAAAAGTPVSLCGEMGGTPEATVVLLGMGLRSFSVSPYHAPLVKKVIRSVDLDDARILAHRAFELGSTTEIRELLQQHALELVPELREWMQPER